MTRYAAEKAATSFWRREASRDQERVWAARDRHGEGSPELAAALADVESSHAKLVEAEEAYSAAIRRGASA